MSAHKPGPWTLCFDGQIDAADGSTVCTFHWNSFKEFSESEEAGTARLIAAAPELIAALIAARNELNEFRVDTNSMPSSLRTVNAAIAKATGVAA